VDFSHELIRRSGYDRAGFAAHYDRFRPRPPVALLAVLCRYAQRERPALVVDLGCGTGLSARAWSGIAERIVGIEPNAAMLAVAEPAPDVEYREAFAHETGISEGDADIVRCSQSLHWMEPEPTFAEAARILRPGGVFAAYDYDWPPVVDPEVDAAFVAYQERRRELRRARGIRQGADRWPKDGHLRRMRSSGHFRVCREVLAHSVFDGDAGTVVGFARSLGMPVVDLTDAELERELGVDELENVTRQVLGERAAPIHFGYRIRMGVR
jgi:SAM-dependent methyltransferase